jgi:hypothetical protein
MIGSSAGSIATARKACQARPPLHLALVERVSIRSPDQLSAAVE